MKCFLVQDWLGPEGQKVLDWFEGDDVLRLRTAMSGTKLERAVSPECNEIVPSKRNFKKRLQKTGETTPTETAIM